MNSSMNYRYEKKTNTRILNAFECQICVFFCQPLLYDYNNLFILLLDLLEIYTCPLEWPMLQ